MMTVAEPSVDLKELSTTVVGDVFSTMLQSEAVVASEPDDSRRYPVASTVYFAGDWRGTLLVELDYNLAYTIAERMEDVPRPVSVDDYVRDALGELTNMFAGNLKPLLPEGTVMAMPSVTHGDDFSLSFVGARTSSSIPFESPHGAFRLTLVEVK